MNSLSLITAISGIIGIYLCGLKKIQWFYFGFIQVITCAAVAINNCLWGNLIQNIVSLIMLIFGFLSWIKNYNGELETKRLSYVDLSILLCCSIGLILFSSYIFILLNNPHPYLDAISYILIIIAQFLLILRYREQWLFYFIADIATLILWIKVQNPFLIVQYCILLINCIYGWFKWSEQKPV